MKHLGDITKISGAMVPIVDIVCGGSPCQDLSVAGLRKGLLHSDLGNGETTRSGLFMEQIRIIKEMREADSNGRSDDDIRHVRPRYMVWENVCGAFSSNKGEDFRAVLEETAKVADKDAIIPRPANGKWSYSGCIMGDGWSIAWRTHDAQYWGVPQRRKRICLVADFDGDTAGKILFDVQLRGEAEYAEAFKTVADIGTESRPEVQPVSESLSRDSEQSEPERKGIAADVKGCFGEASWDQIENGCLNSWDVQSKHIQSEGGVAESLYSGECRYGGGESYVMQETHAISFQERAGKPGGGKGILIQDERTGSLSTQNIQSVCQGISGDVAGTLDASYYKGCGERQGIEREVVCCLNDQGGDVMNVSEDVTAALRAQEHGHQPVVYGISAYESNSMKSNNPHSGVYQARTARSLDINGGNPACNQGGMAVVCLEGNGSRESHKGDGYAESETMYTLNTVEQHAVCIGNGQVDQLKESDKVGALNCMHDQQAILTYGLDRASFNQGENAKFDFCVEEELSAPIVARGPGGAAVFRRE